MGRISRSDLMSGYLITTPDTSRLSMQGSFSRMKSARTGSRASGFTSGPDPSPSWGRHGKASQPRWWHARTDLRPQTDGWEEKYLRTESVSN